MISKRRTPRAPRPDGGANLDDGRVIAALKQYQAALESGKPPARREFLARHADIADELLPCLAGLELLHKAVMQMRLDAADPPLTFAAEHLGASAAGLMANWG
jgi:hypothetical protein